MKESVTAALDMAAGRTRADLSGNAMLAMALTRVVSKSWVKQPRN
jgi:hypothetical protein